MYPGYEAQGYRKMHSLFSVNAPRISTQGLSFERLTKGSISTGVTFEVDNAINRASSPSGGVETGRFRDKALPALPLPSHARIRPHKLRKPAPGKKSETFNPETISRHNSLQSIHSRTLLLNKSANRKPTVVPVYPHPYNQRMPTKKLSKRRDDYVRHSFANLPSSNPRFRERQTRPYLMDFQASHQAQQNKIHEAEAFVRPNSTFIPVQFQPGNSHKIPRSVQPSRPYVFSHPIQDVPYASLSSLSPPNKSTSAEYMAENRRRWTISTSPLNIVTKEIQPASRLDGVATSTSHYPHDIPSFNDSSRERAELGMIGTVGTKPCIDSPPLVSGMQNSDSAAAAAICEELINSERLYLETLRACISINSSPAPPVQMLLRLLSVIQAGEALLALMEATPTVQGIARAFLSVSIQLESAFVRWSREVAEFFESQTLQSEDSSSNHRGPQSPLPSSRRVGFWKRKLGNIGVKAQSQCYVPNKPDKVWRKNNSGPGLWEMAVLPTQRITRYVFLFKEISGKIGCSHESYALVDLALHEAITIAETAA